VRTRPPRAHPTDPARRGRRAPAAWTTTTYFAEGLPWSLLHQVAAEFFTAIGLPARLVGYTSALHITGSLKFLWSPIVDLVGSLRQWMIATQVIMGVLVGVLALHAHQLEAIAASGAVETTWFWMLLVALGILSATHDIACDGYYMDALDRDAQARYSGLRVAAFRAAMLVGSAGLVYLGGRFGWLTSFAAGGVMLIALAAYHQLLLPRGRNEDNLRKHGSGDRPRLAHVKASYGSFLRQPQVVIVLLFLTTYKLGDALMFSMSKVLLRDLGVTTELRAMVNFFGIGAMIAGATLGGAWVARVGLGRALLPITLLMALSEPLYLLLAGATLPLGMAAAFDVPPSAAQAFAPSLVLITGIITIEQFMGGMATAAQMIFIMRRCHPDHKAAHFAFATALYSFAQMTSGTYSGVFYEAHGPILYFALTSLACVPALALVNFVPTD
jgi:PAT family beta-lactamase induction signal transducer AmpG